MMLTISLFSAEVKSSWRHTCTPVCGFMACCLIKKHSSVWLHGLVLNNGISPEGSVKQNSNIILNTLLGMATCFGL
jgi:hypothetical protein